MGLLLNNGHNIGHWRVMGVLQRYGTNATLRGPMYNQRRTGLLLIISLGISYWAAALLVAAEAVWHPGGITPVCPRAALSQ
jgi:hypothetical protein